MIRDLQYPDDARKVIDALHAGIQYDAALAVLGNSCAKLDLVGGQPDFSTGIRYGGRTADEAVRRDAAGLLSRFSLISMVSRLEVHAQQLLLQRRVIEELGTSAKKMTPDALWKILRQVQQESRGGPVKMCSELVVKTPSGELSSKMLWLAGIYKIRNCLAHRLGVVQMEDVRPKGKSLQDVQDTDRLRAIWIRIKVSEEGKEVKDFPYTTPTGNIKAEFVEYEREWKIGDTLEITPLECQAIGMSLSLLGNHLLADFEKEINDMLGIK
jgi:hypothetical protein